MMATQNYYPGRIPGNDLRAGSAGRGPASGRGFFNGRPEFTPAELGQEVAPLGARGMSVPPSRLPAGRSNLPTFARGAREEGPVYADYRDVTGNVLGGPKSGGPLAAQERFRGPNNKIAKTATAINGGPTIPPTMGDLPPFNPNITSNMATPKLTEYYKVNPGLSAQDTPGAKRPRPARKAAPKSVDNRRYWGDWRDTAGFDEDPIGNFLDNLTGDRKVARKPGTINSPMSPYAGDRFAHGGRAYRGEGGLLGGLGDALSTGISNLRSSKRSPISEGLITAGLGMMASPQHNPLRAIGEGGLLGIQAYNTASEQDREERKRLEEQRSNEDYAKKFPSILELFTDQRSNKSSDLFPDASTSPIVRRRGGTVFRPKYATGGQPQQDEGFDPFEAIGAVGDTIGSGLQSLGDTIGNALMPSAQAQESEPAQARPPRKSSRSPIADGLITAGLGMMASPAHNPLRAIGEGGLRGVQAYETSADAQRKEDKLEDERLANESYTKSLTPKAPAPTVSASDTEEPTVIKTAATAAPKPVAAPARGNVQVDPMAESLQRLNILLTSPELAPKNAAQEKIWLRNVNAAKLQVEVLRKQQSGKDASSKGESEFQKEFAKKDAESVSAALIKNQETVEAADRDMAKNQELIEALQAGKLGTGKAYSRAEYEFKRNVDWGDNKEYARLGNMLDSLSVQSMLDAFNGRLSTGVTDEDRRAIMKIVPSFDQTPEYNIDALQVKNAALQRAKKMNDWIRDEYLPSHNGSIQPDFKQKLNEWSHAQPRLIPERLAKTLDDGTKSKESPSKSNTPSGAVYEGTTKSGRAIRKYSDGSVRDAKTGEVLVAPTEQ